VAEEKEADQMVMLCARLPEKDRQIFAGRAELYHMNASQMIRELVRAFVEDRITIAPPKNLHDLYTFKE
jgi:hypothetical protein